MNFMSIPPVTPLDASLFDILLQQTKLEKNRTSQITPSHLFTQNNSLNSLVFSLKFIWLFLTLIFYHSCLFFFNHNLSFGSFGTNQTNQFFFLQNSIENLSKDKLVELTKVKHY